MDAITPSNPKFLSVEVQLAKETNNLLIEEEAKMKLLDYLPKVLGFQATVITIVVTLIGTIEGLMDTMAQKIDAKITQKLDEKKKKEQELQESSAAPAENADAPTTANT